jgi:hypothetical protein
LDIQLEFRINDKKMASMKYIIYTMRVIVWNHLSKTGRGMEWVDLRALEAKKSHLLAIEEMTW